MVVSKKRAKIRDSFLMRYGADSLSRSRLWRLEDAINAIKEFPCAKFNESFDINVKLNIKGKKKDISIRGIVELPYGDGKEKKILAICKPGDEEKCLKAGATYAGGEDYIDKISQGFSDFTTVVADITMLLKVTRVSRILSNMNKMPTSKAGTVGLDIIGAIGKILNGQIEYRAEDTGVVQASVGRISFDSSHLIDNVIAFLNALIKKSASNAGSFSIKSVKLSSTMGFPLFIKFSDIINKV